MKILKKLYDKKPLFFSLIWIFLYVILMSVGDSLSSLIGVEKLITLIIGIGLCLTLFIFIKINNLSSFLGLCKPTMSPKKMIYYIPCLILLSANFWFGIRLNYTLIETIIYILTMFCVGFLEELIFRGLLFNTMKKDSLKAAIIVSSLTFGFGHIINLFNGSNMDLISNLFQIIYATSAGFMFVMIYYKTNSLIACILIHSLFNAFSAFEVEPNLIELKIISCVVITIITGLYALYLTKIKKIDCTINLK